MKEFQLSSACPGCGYAGTGMEGAPINKAARCTAQATDVPLRCPDCADPAEVEAWGTTHYEQDGKTYRPVTMPIIHNEGVPVHDGYEEPDEFGNRKEKIRMENRERLEIVVDVPATLAAGQLTPPATIPHVHRTCIVCGTTWPELLKG